MVSKRSEAKPENAHTPIIADDTLLKGLRARYWLQTQVTVTWTQYRTVSSRYRGEVALLSFPALRGNHTAVVTEVAHFRDAFLGYRVVNAACVVAQGRRRDDHFRV